jgi:cell division protease FtsH
LNTVSRNAGLWALIILLAFLFYSMVAKPPPRDQEISFSEFIAAVEDGRVADVVIQGQNVQGQYLAPEGKDLSGFRTYTPEDPGLVGLLRE